MLRKFQGREALKSDDTLRMSASFLMTLSRVGFLTLASSMQEIIQGDGIVAGSGKRVVATLNRAVQGILSWEA